MKKAIIIGLVTGKGGVGKTATSVNLATGLALKGKKTLILDIDKQGNTTKHLKCYNPKKPSIVDVILNNADPIQTIQKTKIENLDIIPSSYELEDVPDKIMLDINKSREKRLKAIESLDYDYIIIDCPPDLAIITINALVICDYVMVPMIADFYSLEGFDKITAKMDMVRDNHNSKLKLLGVFINFDRNTTANKKMKVKLQNAFKDKFFNTSIRQCEKVRLSTFAFEPVVTFDPNATASIDYMNLVQEVMKNGK
jgi:chromosome partitioning protein